MDVMSIEQAAELIEKLDKIIDLLERNPPPWYTMPVFYTDQQWPAYTYPHHCPVCGKTNCHETHITMDNQRS